MKHILITGINGFLGRNIAKQMLSEKNIVFGVSQHTSKIKELLPKIEFHECDLANIPSIESSIIEFAPDVVIHCAWWGGNSYADTNDPGQLHKNLPGMSHLLETLANVKNNVHFVGIGTSSEYGATSEHSHETDLEAPVNLYGTCKLLAKIYSEKFCQLNGMSWTWVRPFYAYGPGDVATRLIPRTITACIKKEPLHLNSCDSITDYLHVDDLISALCLLIEMRKEGIYNLCSGNQYKIRDIVELIGKLTKNSDNIHFNPTLDRKGFPKMICGNNSKIKALGWNPKITLREGIENLVWNE